MNKDIIHKVNNILAHMMLSTELLLRGGPTAPAKQKKHLVQMLSDIKKLQKFLAEL